jgi:hypothetical protein
MRAVDWWQLVRSRFARRRYLRQTLRMARRDVLLRPPSRVAAVLAVVCGAVAFVPLGLAIWTAVSFPGSPALLILGGVLVTGQLATRQFLARRSPRMVRNWKRLFAALEILAVLGVAVSPLGTILYEAWRDTPFLWQYSGLGLLLTVAAVTVAGRFVLYSVGLVRLLTSRPVTWVLAVGGFASRLLVGYGELAFLLAGVFHPDPRLISAAVVLAAAQTAVFVFRVATKSTSERLVDVMTIIRIDPEMRRRELAGWAYDRLISRGGGGEVSLPRALISLARSLAPDVTRDPRRKMFRSTSMINLGTSQVLLEMAGETIDLIENTVLPNRTGLEHLDLERQIVVLRAGMAEVQARQALASGSAADAMAHLASWAEGLTIAGLPNLAATAWTLRAAVAIRYAPQEHEPFDRLDEISHDDLLSLVVRRPALRLAAAGQVHDLDQEPDLEAARARWRLSKRFTPQWADYRTVAAEARFEAGSGWWQRLRPRRQAKGRVYERRLAIVAEDTLVLTAMAGQLW